MFKGKTLESDASCQVLLGPVCKAGGRRARPGPSGAQEAHGLCSEDSCSQEGGRDVPAPEEPLVVGGLQLRAVPWAETGASGCRYRAPELLLGTTTQTTSIDMW